MATPERRYGGITVGGIIVIVGIVLVIVWSFWIGLIVALRWLRTREVVLAPPGSRTLTPAAPVRQKPNRTRTAR